jgi:hypothetical protein
MRGNASLNWAKEHQNQGTLHNRAPARQVCRKNMGQNAVAKEVFLTSACSVHRRGWSKSLFGIVIMWMGFNSRRI